MNTPESTMLTQKSSPISLPCPSLATRRLPAPHFLEPTLRAAVRDCNLQRFVTLDGMLQRENRGHEDRWTTSGASVGRLVRPAFSPLRHENLCIIRAGKSGE